MIPQRFWQPSTMIGDMRYVADVVLLSLACAVALGIHWIYRIFRRFWMFAYLTIHETQAAQLSFWPRLRWSWHNSQWQCREQFRCFQTSP